MIDSNASIKALLLLRARSGARAGGAEASTETGLGSMVGVGWKLGDTFVVG